MKPKPVNYASNSTDKAVTGFSMVELLIAIAIVAILVSVAIPSYQRAIIKSRHTDAKELLYTVAHQQQQYFTQNYAYTAVTGQTGIRVATTSSNGYYTLTIAVPDPPSAYSISAVPVPGTSQANDTACGTFTLTSLGVKSVSGSQTSPPCW